MNLSESLHLLFLYSQWNGGEIIEILKSFINTLYSRVRWRLWESCVVSPTPSSDTPETPQTRWALVHDSGSYSLSGAWPDYEDQSEPTSHPRRYTPPHDRSEPSWPPRFWSKEQTQNIKIQPLLNPDKISNILMIDCLVKLGFSQFLRWIQTQASRMFQWIQFCYVMNVWFLPERPSLCLLMEPSGTFQSNRISLYSHPSFPSDRVLWRAEGRAWKTQTNKNNKQTNENRRCVCVVQSYHR